MPNAMESSSAAVSRSGEPPGSPNPSPGPLSRTGGYRRRKAEALGVGALQVAATAPRRRRDRDDRLAPAALVASGLLLTPALVLYGRAMRHHGTELDLEELPQAVQAGA